MANKNKILIILILALVTAGVYFTGIYTYFIKKEIKEERPMPAGMEPEQAEAAIKILKSGNFVDVDFIHKGSGRAFLLEYPDGSKVLRFEDFNITNGPDLFVYLAETTAPTGDLEGLGNYIDLGRLKGNAGNQNYELPAGIGNFNSVVIWCKKFGVLFPYAVMH